MLNSSQVLKKLILIKKDRVVFIAKTDLNTDGRILNELKILEYNNASDMVIDFLVLLDKPLQIEFGSLIKIHPVKTLFRNSNIFRFLTVIEFTLRSLVLLFKLDPKILHVQDTAVVLPAWLFQMLRRKSFKLIYDDHEMPNENEGFQKKIFNFFETRLMKSADWVIFANEERMNILKQRNKLKNRTTYFLNLPYFEEEKAKEVSSADIREKLRQLEEMKRKGIKFVIHQGVIKKERGAEKLANFSKILPSNYKILLLGGSKVQFIQFIAEHNLKTDNFYFIGTVNYDILSKFWELGDVSIVMYLPYLINNCLCAPNRFYISLQKRIPVIVNKNNPVLSNFISRYKCGFFIEDFNERNFELVEAFNKREVEFTFERIKREQIESFLSVYRNID